VTDNEAFAGYPEHQEVQRLAELGARGDWRFAVQHEVEGEQAPSITGIRAWPDGSADLLVVRDYTVAQARRTNPAGGIVWRHEAGLGEVVDGLLELAPPEDPRAPTRVIGAGPNMWTSG
jgi:hypothetical protein